MGVCHVTGDYLFQGSDEHNCENMSTSNTTTKLAKTMKKETIKLSENKPQPTPEQLRIAQLINTKKEDPKLKEKLTQVMDATQRSMEEAYIALHDSEFDPNRAVNLLLEGDVDTQWSTLSKKKKTRNPGEKPIKNKGENIQDVSNENEPWDSSLNAKPSIGNRGPSSRGRGRGGRGRGSGFQQPEFIDRGRRFNRVNNVTNDEREEGSSVIQSRTFERVIPPTVRPIDTWDPKRPISSMLNKNRSYDWDEEEYTGSLSSSLVYTSSGNSPVPKSSNESTTTTISSTEPKTPLSYEPSRDVITSTASYQPNVREQASTSAVSSPPQMASSFTPSPLKIKAPPLGASVTKPLSKVDKLKENQGFSGNKSSSKPVIVKSQSKPVEMPPDSNTIGLIDIQFGSIDLKEETNEIPLFSSKPTISTNTKETENRSSNLNSAIDPSGNGFPSNTNVTISTSSAPILTKESITQVSNNPKKSQPPTSVHSPSYLSSLATYPSISPNSCSSPQQNTYTSAAGGIGGIATSACLPFHYSNYVTQPSQSVPVLPNLTNSYQNILGTPAFTTSQSIYGSNILPTSSYTVPYQTYSSTAQHKPPLVPLPFTTSKDFESGSHNVNLTLASRSAVPTATSMLSTNQPFPSTKSANLPKNPILSNMPPLIGHQHHPLFIGQGAIPYFQPPIYYQDLQMMQQQRLASPINAAYYDVGYTSLARDGMHVKDRILPKPENPPLQHGNPMIGGYVAGHLSSSNDVFGTETDNYANCENTNGNFGDNSESCPSNQLIQSGMGLMATTSNDPIDICSKSINSTHRKNEYD